MSRLLSCFLSLWRSNDVWFFSQKNGSPLALYEFHPCDPSPAYHISSKQWRSDISMRGCPIQAIVHAYGLDERTIAEWSDHASRSYTGQMADGIERSTE